jgi:hypothetical protein
MVTEVAAEPQVNAVCELHSWVLVADAEVAPTNAIAAIAATAARPSILMSLTLILLPGGLPPSWFFGQG